MKFKKCFFVAVSAIILTPALYCETISSSTVKIVQPVRYGVYQRKKDNTADVPICILSNRKPARVEARWKYAEVNVKKSTDTVIFREWQPISFEYREGQIIGYITLAAGGWYILQVRAGSNEADSEIYEMEYIGVGDVFVTAGQSNAANYGQTLQTTQTGLVVSFDGKKWSLADDPQPIAGGYHGSIWPIVGDMLQETLLVPIGFLNVAVGGTSIKHWDPELALSTTTFTCYTRMQKYVLLLKPFGHKAVLWHQGEGDWHESTYPYYYDGLKKLILAYKKDFADVPWMIAVVGNNDTRVISYIGEQGSRRAQKEIIKEGLALKGPDTDILPPYFRTDKRADFSSRFDAEGLIAHARLWYACLIYNFYNEVTVENYFR
jgi:hypothetical protein